MIVDLNSNLGFKILEDTYPFTESKELCLKLDDWWKAPSRINNEGKQNYTLDLSVPSSLENSFNKKLKDGIFSFLFFNNEVIAYAGLVVKDNEGWMHRITKKPNIDSSLFGLTTTVFIPYHIRKCIDLKLSTYFLSFNNHNQKLYDFFRLKKYLRVQTKFPEEFIYGSEVISAFEFAGLQKVNYVDQWVCKLDLTRTDIKDLIKY